MTKACLFVIFCFSIYDLSIFSGSNLANRLTRRWWADPILSQIEIRGFARPCGDFKICLFCLSTPDNVKVNTQYRNERTVVCWQCVWMQVWDMMSGSVLPQQTPIILPQYHIPLIYTVLWPPLFPMTYPNIQWIEISKQS